MNGIVGRTPRFDWERSHIKTGGEKIICVAGSDYSGTTYATRGISDIAMGETPILAPNFRFAHESSIAFPKRVMRQLGIDPQMFRSERHIEALRFMQVYSLMSTLTLSIWDAEQRWQHDNGEIVASVGKRAPRPKLKVVAARIADPLQRQRIAEVMHVPSSDPKFDFERIGVFVYIWLTKDGVIARWERDNEESNGKPRIPRELLDAHLEAEVEYNVRFRGVASRKPGREEGKWLQTFDPGVDVSRDTELSGDLKEAQMYDRGRDILALLKLQHFIQG